MRVWLNPDKVAAQQFDGERRRQRHSRAECAGRRRRHRAATSRKPVDFELQINAKGRLIDRQRSSANHRQDRAERRKDSAQRRGAHRTERRQLFVAFAAEQQDRGGVADFSIARRERASTLHGRARNDG